MQRRKTSFFLASRTDPNQAACVSLFLLVSFAAHSSTRLDSTHSNGAHRAQVERQKAIDRATTRWYCQREAEEERGRFRMAEMSARSLSFSLSPFSHALHMCVTKAATVCAAAAAHSSISNTVRTTSRDASGEE